MRLITEAKQVVGESFSAACRLLSLDLADAASRHCEVLHDKVEVFPGISNKRCSDSQRGYELIVENQWWKKFTQMVKVLVWH